MIYRILITDDISTQGLKRLENADNVSFDIIKGLKSRTLTQCIAGYDGLIVRSSVKVTEEVLTAADKLKVIGRAGIGIDNIHIMAASTRGIIVMNTPDANTIATVEHAMALLLALCRHIPQAYTSLRGGQWDRKRFTGSQLYSKTLGIIGMGRIGSKVAAHCQSFGMDIITYDPYLSNEVAEEMKVQRVDLSELLARSDFITLHAALTPDTKQIINAEAIAQMKTGVRIINTARGQLINEPALIEGLQQGKISGAALDVFTEEPLSPHSPLLSMNNVIITPHLAASTEEAQCDVGTQIVDQMLDALSGHEYRNAINMPIVDASLLSKLRPILDLAEKVGSLLTQLAEDAIQRIEVEIKGDEICNHIKPITVAILKGSLDPILNQRVNYVNAPHLARERGITVSQISGLSTPDYPNQISCRAEWSGGSRTIAATLFSHNEPRLVQIDGYQLDVHPEGTILVIISRDKPGFIGRVGTILGKHNINIATWRTGRAEPGGLAISFISVDQDIPECVLKILQDFELVTKATKVRL